MKKDFKIRGKSEKLSSLTMIVLLGLILCVAYFLIQDVSFGRFDLTAKKRYTLTDTTKEILGELQNPVKAMLFISSGLSSQDNGLEQQVTDLLSDYKQASSGRFDYEIIRPETPEEEELAKGLNIFRVAVSERKEDSVGMHFVYKSLAIVSDGRAEIISNLKKDDNLEYLISKSILAATNQKRYKAGFLQGFGSIADTEIFMATLTELYDNVYGGMIEVSGVTIEDGKLSEDVDALVMLNLTEKLSQSDLEAIDDAFSAGTALGIFQSPTKFDPEYPDQPRLLIDNGLNAWLEKRGIVLKRDLILDRKRNLVGSQLKENGAVSISQPALPMLTKIDRQSTVTQNLKAVVFPFTGSMEINAPTLRVTELIRSSEDSVSRKAGGDISWESLREENAGEEKASFLVAAALEGEFSPLYNQGQPRFNRMLIFSNGEFLFSNKTIGYPDNFARIGVHLFVNATDFLIQDERLSRIRNRELPEIVPIPDASARFTLRLVNIVAVPGCVLLIGLGLHLRRRMGGREKKRVS